MNKKKLFSGISSAVLILGSLSPMQAFAQTDGDVAFQETSKIEHPTSGNLGDNANWKLEENTLTLEGDFNNDNAYKIPAEWPWYGIRERVESVKFGAGFKLSGSAFGLFAQMSNLKNINLAGFDTSGITSMKDMFWGCSSLTSLDLTSFDTSNVTDMFGMFLKCESLENLVITSFDTSKVKDMNSMFAYCEKLPSLDVTHFNTSEVLDMKSMFNSCKKLESINLSSFDTRLVKDMDSMFAYCSELTRLDLSTFETYETEDMSFMFGCCTNLGSILMDPEKFDICSAKETDLMFYNCTALKSLDIQNWYPKTGSKKSDMFLNSGLETVLITASGEDLLPELAKVSPTWHVNKKGPYAISTDDNTNTVLDKIKEDRADYSFPVSTLDKKLYYSLDYWSHENEKVHLGTNGQFSPTGNCEFIIGELTPTRSGYTFLGWADIPDAAQAKYQAGDEVTLNLASDGLHKDLYAVWRKNSNSSSGSSSSSNRVNLSSVHEMHRLYNPNSGEHFYTKETAERDHLVNVGWNYEGTAWYSPKSSSSPVYRLYNPNAGDHHYTLDAKEKDELVKLGWRYEGIGWYSASKSNGQAIHRQYNPNAVAGAHNFTTDENERDFLINNGWSHEGVAWYGVHPKNIKK